MTTHLQPALDRGQIPPALTAVPSWDHLRAAYPGEEEIWAVDVPHQILRVWREGGWEAPRPVSTAAAGLGNRPDSGCTPLGAHRVHEVIGVGFPIGQPFVARKPAGHPLLSFTGGRGEAILSRVITLNGLVPGLNHHSLERFIYLHGTDQEERLGQPVSHGCIRLANADIITLADRLGPLRPLVWIGRVSDWFDSTPPG